MTIDELKADLTAARLHAELLACDRDHYRTEAKLARCVIGILWLVIAAMWVAFLIL